MSDEEKQALATFDNNGGVKWKEFRLGDLFEIETSKKRFDANKVQIEESKGYPYIVRTALNNGQRGFIDEDKQYLNDGNTISFGQDTTTMFYQEKPYFTGDKIKILKPKYEEFGKSNAQFFLATMRQTFSLFSWGSSSFNVDVIESQNVQLPATADGLPDFSAMQTLIRAVEKLVIKDVVEYSDNKISATKEVITKNKRA